MELNSIVVVSLHSPKERIWGQLLDLSTAGVTVQGLDVNGFSDWINQIGSEEHCALATVFYPLYRVERIALDEPVGNVPSLAAMFAEKLGMSLGEYLTREKAQRP
jgi:hypothetical protein